MWDKLLALFKEKPLTDEVRSVVPDVQEVSQSPKVMKMDGPSTHIGFNYMKGLDDEDDINQSRKFINLNKLLRGDYKHEQTEKTSGEPENNIRRKNTK